MYVMFHQLLDLLDAHVHIEYVAVTKLLINHQSMGLTFLTNSFMAWLENSFCLMSNFLTRTKKKEKKKKKKKKRKNECVIIIVIIIII